MARAQALVEFALALPVLLLLMLAVFDAGRVAVAAGSLSNGAREGARTAAVLYPAEGWESAAAARARSAMSALDLSLLSVVVTSESASGATYVELQTTYRFRPIAPVLTLGRTDIPMTASSRMRARQ